MINWPEDKRTILAFLMMLRDDNGKVVIDHLESEYKRLMTEGYKNLNRVSEYAGAVKTLEAILDIFNRAQERWAKMKDQEKGRIQ
uniref:Uncharacterized protein n=1 Tax=viral metagenome TaxID=1070528 RepID=A0A6M3Y2V4_9ZZZZ